MKVWLAFLFEVWILSTFIQFLFYDWKKIMNKYSSIGSIISDLLSVLMKEQNPNSSNAVSIWDDVGTYANCWKSQETKGMIR